MARPLNPRQLKFVEFYLAGDTATEAYVKAGYKGRGRSAESGASELLSNPVVQEAIHRATVKATAKAELTAEWVLAEMLKLAALDPRKMFHPDGTPKAITELDDDTAAAVSGFEVETETRADGSVKELDPQPHGGALERNRGPFITTRTVKVKFWDKRLSLVELGKRFNLFPARTELTGGGGGPITHDIKGVTFTPDDLAAARAVLALAGRHPDGGDLPPDG